MHMEKRIELDGITRDVLDILIDEKSIVWVCYPRLVKGIISGPSEEYSYEVCKVMYDKIYPYEVAYAIDQHISTYRLCPISLVDKRLSEDPVANRKCANAYETLYFIDVNGELFLRDDAYAFTSYEMAEEMRDRLVEELRADEKKTTITKPTEPDVVFSLEEAKEALSQVHNIPISKIKINL